MKRVQRSKPVTAKGLRTRRVDLRLTEDVSAKGLALKIAQMKDCEMENGCIQSLTEWNLVRRSNGQPYQYVNKNVLEVGSMPLDLGHGDYCELYYMLTTDGSFIYYNEAKDGYYVMLADKGRVDVCPVMGKDTTSLALFTEKGFFIGSLQGTYQTVIAEDTLAVGAYFKHRIFVGMKGSEVRYSAPEDFLNFNESSDEGGRMRFSNCGGEIVAMQVYDDALYIFFQSGILRLTASGEPSKFRAEQLDYAGDYILRRTICVCQNAIYFMSASGVYRVKGKKVERLPVKLKLPIVENGKEGCAVWKDRPIFRYNQTGYQTILLSRDGKTAYPMSDLKGLGRSAGGRVLFVDSYYQFCELINGGIYDYNGTFTAVETDLGYMGKKRLTSIYLQGEGSCFLTMATDLGTIWTKQLTFVGGSTQLSRRDDGNFFTFRVELGPSSKISAMQVAYTTRK